MNALTRIPRRILIGFVRMYRLILSPHIGGACRYTPTCSEYSIEALERYGAVKGSILSIHRIMRCNPWGGHGYDPPIWYAERRATEDETEHETEQRGEDPASKDPASTDPAMEESA